MNVGPVVGGIRTISQALSVVPKAFQALNHQWREAQGLRIPEISPKVGPHIREHLAVVLHEILLQHPLMAVADMRSVFVWTGGQHGTITMAPLQVNYGVMRLQIRVPLRLVAEAE